MARKAGRLRPSPQLPVELLDQDWSRHQRCPWVDETTDRVPLSGPCLGARDPVPEPLVAPELVALVAEGEAQKIQTAPSSLSLTVRVFSRFGVSPLQPATIASTQSVMPVPRSRARMTKSSPWRTRRAPANWAGASLKWNRSSIRWR